MLLRISLTLVIIFISKTLFAQPSILANYEHLDPNRKIPTSLLQRAVTYFHKNKSSFKNKDYITIVDFSKRSNNKRMHIINMSTGSVWSVRTAHGKGGDLDHDGYVESLGNVPGSKKSSRGFYKVAEVYHGTYGRSLRLDGLSTSNSKARSRAIVLHGADYVKEANVIQGRSWGCFVLSWSVKNSVIDRIKNGSLMYADWSH